MTQDTSPMFGIPPVKKVTPAMISTLKKHKIYYKGIEYDVAQERIRKIAEAHEPRTVGSVAYAMAKFLREKREMEEKVSKSK